MRTCNNCKGSSIKSRQIYPHGRKSKAITILTCKKCGSTDVEVKVDSRRFQKKRK